MSLVCLRVLSGPHLGAAIELPPGRFQVGSSPEADIVLAADDTVAGRHLELEVGEEAVTARPLEAPVTLDGLELPPEGGAVLPGAVLALGFTALAWRPAGESWEHSVWVRGRTESVTGAVTSGSAPEEEPGPEAAEESDPEGPSEDAPERDDALDRPLSPKEWAHHWGLRVGLAVLFLLLVLIVLGNWGRGLTRQGAADRLNALLAENGLPGVRAETEDGALALRGLAADDLELALITRLAGAQPFPVRVEVRILADRLRAVRETMNARGFFPEVRLGPEGRLEIAVYMKDSLVEDQAFSRLEDDLKGLDRAERRVVHAWELEPVLERELGQAGLGRVKPEYLEGLVRLSLTPDAGERPRLNEALERVSQTLGAPIVFQLADGRLERAKEPAHAPGAAGPGSMEVMSVTQGALPFITMSNGQKFFVGAVLPNGATLVAIEPGRLRMALGEEIIIHNLEDLGERQ